MGLPPRWAVEARESPEHDEAVERAELDVLLRPKGVLSLRSRRGSVGRILVFAVLPVALVVWFLTDVPRATYAWDFSAFWHAANAMGHGGNPYPAGHIDVSGPLQVYVYPPLLGELLLPLGYLPFLPAAIVFIVASALALLAALWVLGVKDWRCYGAVFLWMPTLHALRLGALTPFLVLLVAVALRFDARRFGRRVGLIGAVALKLFLWPLFFWEGAVRGVAPVVRSAAVALMVVVASWAFIGFEGMTSYPHLLRVVEEQWVANGYGIATVLNAIGLPTQAITWALFALAAVSGLSVAALTRRGSLTGQEAFVLLLAAALLLSPVLWLHYAALLAVPLAVLSPRFDRLWCVPLLFWLTPSEESNGDLWRVAIGIVAVALTVGLAIRRGRAAASPSAVVARAVTPAVGTA